MMKQGIKMMESRTAFLLILIPTDLHVGILSPPRLAPLSLPPMSQIPRLLVFTHLTSSHGCLSFTIFWHHSMKSQKRCNEDTKTFLLNDLLTDERTYVHPAQPASQGQPARVGLH